MANTKTEKKRYLALAQTITLITTPAIVGSLTLFYTLYYFSPSLEIFYKTFFSVLVLSIIMPVLFIFFLMKKGHIGNFHMKERKDRVLPFGFTLISGIISLLIIKYLENDPELLKMFLIFFLMALGYSVITFLKFKPSGHVFVFASAVLALAFFIDTRFAYSLILIAPIGWARVYMKEHTLGEVAGAGIYALFSFWAFSMLISA
ncbi:hypothetical protein C4544_06375 [candidate division WS5 bacterium]|uniref:Phosphatase PAP2 family protein n=1 Tax=candidate division WS5 bacterium TaxID=2093353 RepID=A0A419DA64_9BACT|nr:MAG: hypothetical protein C4544_06375 [candidate division WS5 bacterium]